MIFQALIYEICYVNIRLYTGHYHLHWKLLYPESGCWVQQCVHFDEFSSKMWLYQKKYFYGRIAKDSANVFSAEVLNQRQMQSTFKLWSVGSDTEGIHNLSLDSKNRDICIMGFSWGMAGIIVREVNFISTFLL